MKNILFLIVLLFAAGTMAGCETAKSTLSGPFIGLEKDMNNLGNATNNMCAGLQKNADSDEDVPEEEKSALRKADDWMREHMW